MSMPMPAKPTVSPPIAPSPRPATTSAAGTTSIHTAPTPMNAAPVDFTKSPPAPATTMPLPKPPPVTTTAEGNLEALNLADALTKYNQHMGCVHLAIAAQAARGASTIDPSESALDASHAQAALGVAIFSIARSLAIIAGKP